MAKVMILLAEGLEEVEALTPIDLLRRAGAQVDTIAVADEAEIKGAHEVRIITDKVIKDISNADLETYDACILPGGAPGYKNLQASSEVKNIVLEMNKSGKLVAAICAAPTVLGSYGLLEGKNACCYPGMEEGMLGAKATTNKVECAGNIITSRGAGTAIDFSLAIVEYLFDKEKADALAKNIVYR